MHRFAPALPLALLLVATAACAERQDNRSSVEAACAAEAERLVLQRNRGRNLVIDNSLPGPQTIMEETNYTTAFARQSEFRDRERLTRECIRQTSEARSRPASSPATPASATPAPLTPASATPAPLTPTSATPRAAPLPPPTPAASSSAPVRGTALPPPAPEAPAASSPASPASTPPIRGW